MTAAPEAGPELPPRPSPFAFPSDTTFRFALLVAAVLGATLYVWDWMWLVLGADKARIVDQSLACLEARDSFAATDTFSACVRDTFVNSTWWRLGGVGLVLALAVGLVLLWPWLKTRSDDFRPLEAEDAPEALATLSELSREAGLAREPRWVWNPLKPGATGVAFGRPGSYSVGLTGGLVVQHVADPAAFRAIVRHELAHIRNRDVSLTYATLSLWYAFLLGAVLPFAVTLVDEGRFALSVTWRLLVLAALVYLTRNAVLRSREVYADLRASVPDGRDGALARVLASLPSRPDGLRHRLLSVHPSPASRVGALRDTRPLFALGPLAAFAAGLAATINFDSVHSLVSLWVDEPFDAAMLAALVFGALVVGVVGVAIWRDRFGALAGGTGTERVWPLAAALTAGLLIGPELSLLEAVDIPSDPGLLTDMLHGDGVLWAVALLAIVALLLGWIAGTSSTWLRAAAARRLPFASTAGLLVASGVMAIVLGTYFTLREVTPALELSRLLTARQHAQVSEVTAAGPRWLWQLVIDSQTLFILAKPLVLLALVSLWAFPLAVVLLRRRRTGEAPWAFLDPGGRIDTERPRVSIVRPLAVGGAGGLACALAYLLYRAGIHAWVDVATRRYDEFLLAFVFWQVVIALVAQALVAAVATSLAHEGVRLAEGLFAACVTGLLATLAIVTGPVVGGCVDPLSVRPGPCTWDVTADGVWDIGRLVIPEGAIAALAGGLLVLGATALQRARHAAGAGRAAPSRAPAGTSSPG